MRKCIATVSISGTLPDKLDAIAAARFDAVEIFENDLISFIGTPSDVKRMVDDRGLAVDLYQPFRDFDAASDAQFKRNLDRAERKFDLMQTLGAPMLLVCSNVSASACDDDARIAAQLHELAERAGQRNLRIGYEALAWGRHVSHYQHAWSIVEKVDHPHLGVVVDSFHILSLGDDPSAIATIPGDKIFFLQMADAPRLAMDVLQWSRHYRSFPGQGQFDVARFLECVLVAGYTGPFSLEIFNDVFREAPNRLTAVDAMRSILYCEAQTRLRLEASHGGRPPNASASRTLERVELFDPPAVPAPEGVAYLEFAVDETAASRLAQVLRTLGFRRAGRHRSKQVTLYRQGSIHLVLNAEPGSFARTFFDDHGVSVVATAYAVDDPLRALNRATSLHCRRFDGRVGVDESSVAAIRAPDDSLVYFVAPDDGTKRQFETDFEIDAEPGASPGAGLTRIDHVARALPIDALDSWILFYRAVLGMEPGESLELSDPFGLVRSCGVATADRAVRVVLNVSQSRGTQMAKALAAQGGATVHHIAFACDDIFAAMATMQAAGASFVPISGNYYDDLSARFGLDASLILRMRAANVLYERTDDGEYFHAYSESFAERFFFEIVQRVGQYDGYGAMNAPVRLASQIQRPASH